MSKIQGNDDVFAQQYKAGIEQMLISYPGRLRINAIEMLSNIINFCNAVQTLLFTETHKQFRLHF